MKAPPPWRSWAIASAGSTKAASTVPARPGRVSRAFEALSGARRSSRPCAAEHLVDQVVLAAEVVVDRGDVDVRAAGHPPQRSSGEPCAANSSSAACRIRSWWRSAAGSSGSLPESNACLILGRVPRRVNGQPTAGIGKGCGRAASSVKFSAAISAKPAPVRGFSVIFGSANWEVCDPPDWRISHGAGAHHFDHQARCRCQERHRRNLFPLRRPA